MLTVQIYYGQLAYSLLKQTKTDLYSLNFKYINPALFFLHVLHLI